MNLSDCIFITDEAEDFADAMFDFTGIDRDSSSINHKTDDDDDESC